MIVVVLFSFITLLLTYLDSRGVTKHGMKVGFILIGFLGCIHYDYGNDYMRYLELYEEFKAEPFLLSKIISKEYFRESGWYVLNHVFQYLGGFLGLVAFLNIIQTSIVYWFIEKYVSREWRVLSVFTYLFTTSYYLLSFSMMRQELIIILFLGLWPFIYKKQWWITLPVLLLCTTIHNSAWVLVPFAFWGFLPAKKRFLAVIYVVVLVSLWLFSDLLEPILNSALSFEDFSYYTENYMRDNQMKFGLGFIIQLLPFVLSIYFLISNNYCHNKSDVLVVALSAIFFLITPFGQIIPMIGRIGMYFGIYRLASLPLIYKSVSDRFVRGVFIFVNVVVTLYDYWYFFHDEVYSQSYSEFHTIFSVI